MQDLAKEKCGGCGRRRRKRERWFYRYPEITPRGKLVPISVVCPACATPAERADRRKP